MASRPVTDGTLTHTTHTLQAADGTRLFLCQAEHPAARARVMLVHGYAEHCGRYAQVIELLGAHGFSVAAGDLRGHGRSAGRRGHISRFDHYVQDVQVMLEHLGQHGPDGATPPLFLVGHSLGGLVAACHAQLHPGTVDGLILVAPFVDLKFVVPRWKRSLAQLVSGLWPSFHLASGVPSGQLSRDPEYLARLEADPLAFKHATARWFTETIAAQRRALSPASPVQVPRLLMLAGDDAIVCNEAARRLHVAMGTQAAQVREYPECYHDLLHEPGHDRIIDDLAGWIDAQIDALVETRP